MRVSRCRASIPEGKFPAILGHEGAGVVRELGAGVTDLSRSATTSSRCTPRNAAAVSPACRSAPTSATAIRSTQGQGVMPDGTSRFSCVSTGGSPGGSNSLFHYMGCSTFANFTVLPEIALAKVREDAPFDKICYIGCGVTTGHRRGDQHRQGLARRERGGVRPRRHRPQRDPGRPAMVGADKIIGVDLNPEREALARKFGMTHFVNPTEVEGDTWSAIWSISPAAARTISFECIGNVRRHAPGAGMLPQGLGRVDHHRRRRRRPGDLHPAVPAGHRPGLEGHRLRRRQAAAPTCRRSSTGTWRARSTSTT